MATPSASALASWPPPWPPPPLSTLTRVASLSRASRALAACALLRVRRSQGAMMERWSAARAEAELEEMIDAQRAADPSLELLEERKRKRIAEWRDGVTHEEAERNNNFVAVGGDWRERVARRAKQRREGEGQSTESGMAPRRAFTE